MARKTPGSESLFDPRGPMFDREHAARGVPYQPHSKTSRAAAGSQSPGKLTGDREKVYQYLAYRGSVGATDAEIALDCVLNPSTARPRRIDLQRMGLIEDSGRTRKTPSGRKATVWIVSERRNPQT